MKHKLIHTENYLLVVDNKFSRYGLHLKKNEILNITGVGEKSKEIHHNKGWNKDGEVLFIQAHLPLNNSPILEGVDLLPPLEDDVEVLIPFPTYKLRDGSEIKTWMNGWEEGHKEGYNKAKETYKYTEEDLKKAINLAYVSGGGGDTYQECEAFVMEQLQKELPIAFECEMEENDYCSEGENCKGNDLKCDGHTIIKIEPKTTTNSQGQTAWVGTYKY